MHSRTAERRAADVEELVRRYFSVVADLASTEDDLRPLLDPDLCVVEHPNAVTPHGARRDLADTITGFHAGKKLLRAQQFDIHEIITADDRAAIRATWKGTIGVVGHDRPGPQIVAHVAALVATRNGRILHHESFDCYDPTTLPR